MAGDLTLRMLLTAQADQARRELTATSRAVQELGAAATPAGASFNGLRTSFGATSISAAALTAATTGLTRQTKAQAAEAVATARESAHLREELDAVRAQFNPLFAASRQYEQQLREIADAERLGALSAAEVSAARERAAASITPFNTAMTGMNTRIGENAFAVGNLAAQFNDIGVMTLAMQSPLQLAFQQGTQINQVFAGMGGHATGIRSIGAALLSVVSPASLATIGVIALGVAGVQWLMTLRDEALSVADALEAIETSTSALRDATNLATPAGLDELEDRYGRITAQVERLIAARERMALIDSRARLDELNTSFSERPGGGGILHSLSGVLGFTEAAAGAMALRREIDPTVAGAARLWAEIQRLGQLDEPAELADQYARLAAMVEAVITEMGATDERRQFLADLLEAEDKARQIVAILENRGQRDNRRADEMLAELQIAGAIVRYGEDARIVTELRVAAERAAFEAGLRTLDVSDATKDSLRAAWEAANSLAAVDMASGVARARAEASAMADEITRALGAAQGLAAQGAASLEDARIRAQYQDPGEQAYHLGLLRMRRAQAPVRESASSDPILLMGLEAEAEAYARTEAEAARLTAAQRELNSSRRDGARSSVQAREAVEELITDLQTEVAVLRETNPVQQEMIRQRGVLAAATAAERDQVEALIEARIEETEALERTRELTEGVRDAGRDTLRGIISDLRDGASAGDILANVLENIADRLLDMGTTGLADILFGRSGSSSSGILGDLLGGIFGLRKNALGDVIGAPTLFAYGDRPGQLGVMGEAGAEAIIPLTHAFGGGVGAVADGQETTLALTRLKSGKLGVALPSAAQPFALGGAFGVVPAPPSQIAAPATGAAPSQSAAQGEIIGRLEVVHSPDFELRWAGRMRGVALSTAQEQIEAFDRVLPSRVEQISLDPGYRG